MIIVTGGCGFIGSNIIHSLNALGHCDIIVVDDLTDGKKFNNIVDCAITDYIDKDEFLTLIESNALTNVQAIFHQGACSDTTEWDGRHMMAVNYQYSKKLLHFSLTNKCQFIYASSAAIYGARQQFTETREAEKPLNVYGYSKYLFDNYVRNLLPTATCQIVGLRYFNVYGPREQHKGTMASVAYHLDNQLCHGSQTVKLFAAYDGCDAGEQQRDFIYVKDTVDVNLWFMQHPEKSGVFNCGTGRSQTFNDVANAVICYHQKGQIEYIPFPEHLRGAYQSYTQADITHLRNIGYDKPFLTVEQGVADYLAWLHSENHSDNDK